MWILPGLGKAAKNQGNWFLEEWWNRQQYHGGDGPSKMWQGGRQTKHLHRNQFWHWCSSSYDLCDRISTDFVNPNGEELTTPSWLQVAAKMTVSAAWSQKSIVWSTRGQSLDLFLPERILTVWISHLPVFLTEMLLQSAQSGEHVSTSFTLLTRSPLCSEP